jgi:hypothetical protein
MLVGILMALHGLRGTRTPFTLQIFSLLDILQVKRLALSDV